MSKISPTLPKSKSVLNTYSTKAFTKFEIDWVIEWLIFQIMLGNSGRTDARTDGRTLTIPMSPPDFVGGDKKSRYHKLRPLSNIFTQLEINRINVIGIVPGNPYHLHVCLCVWWLGWEVLTLYQIWRHREIRFKLQWHHNGRDGVSNHQPHDCLFNRLFRRRSKKRSKLRVTCLCAGNSAATGEFPAQRAINAENVSIWWHHPDCLNLIISLTIRFNSTEGHSTVFL